MATRLTADAAFFEAHSVRFSQPRGDWLLDSLKGDGIEQ